MQPADTQEVQRVITPHDRLVAARLKAIYARKKAALNLTQEKLARLVGYTQATISCHMNGHIALRGVRGLTAYADALQVSPEEIDPRFRSRFLHEQPSDPPPATPAIPWSGTKPNPDIRPLTPDPHRSRTAYILKDEYTPIFPAGTKLIVDKSTPIYQGNLAVLTLRAGVRVLCAVTEITQRAVEYALPLGFDSVREQHARKKHVDTLYPQTPQRVLFSQIIKIEPVVITEWS